MLDLTKLIKFTTTCDPLTGDLQVGAVLPAIGRVTRVTEFTLANGPGQYVLEPHVRRDLLQGFYHDFYGHLKQPIRAALCELTVANHRDPFCHSSLGCFAPSKAFVDLEAALKTLSPS